MLTLQSSKSQSVYCLGWTFHPSAYSLTSFHVCAEPKSWSKYTTVKCCAYLYYYYNLCNRILIHQKMSCSGTNIKKFTNIFSPSRLVLFIWSLCKYVFGCKLYSLFDFPGGIQAPAQKTFCWCFFMFLFLYTPCNWSLNGGC